MRHFTPRPARGLGLGRQSLSLILAANSPALLRKKDRPMADARRITRQRLESLARAGVTSLPKPRPGAKKAVAAALETPPEAPRAEVAPPRVETSVGIESAADRNEALNVIRAKV